MQTAASLVSALFFGGIDEKIIQRLEQQRPESPAPRIGGLNEAAFQKHDKKILGEILRVRRRIAAPINKGENGAPINLTKLGEIGVGGLLRARDGAVAEQAPARGREVGQRISPFPRNSCIHIFSVLGLKLQNK